MKEINDIRSNVEGMRAKSSSEEEKEETNVRLKNDTF